MVRNQGGVPLSLSCDPHRSEMPEPSHERRSIDRHAPRVICVLGMHRSGTSLITRMLNLLGVDVGPEQKLLSADKFNPTGFWEHQPFVDVNDEIFNRLGGTWRDLPVFPDGWDGAASLSDLRDRATGLVDEAFGRSPVWGWKDPRTCMTLRFWQQVMPPMRYVLCLRNPVDVARSLEHTMPFEQGAALWQAYVKSSLIVSHGSPRTYVFYEDALSDWRREAGRIAEFMGVAPVQRRSDIDDAMARFVNRDLHHHRTVDSQVITEPRLSYPAKAIFLATRMYTTLLRQPLHTGGATDTDLDDALTALAGA